MLVIHNKTLRLFENFFGKDFLKSNMCIVLTGYNGQDNYDLPYPHGRKATIDQYFEERLGKTLPIFCISNRPEVEVNHKNGLNFPLFFAWIAGLSSFDAPLGNISLDINTLVPPGSLEDVSGNGTQFKKICLSWSSLSSDKPLEPNGKKVTFRVHHEQKFSHNVSFCLGVHSNPLKATGSSYNDTDHYSVYCCQYADASFHHAGICTAGRITRTGRSIADIGSILTLELYTDKFEVCCVNPGGYSWTEIVSLPPNRTWYLHVVTYDIDFTISSD